MRDAELEQLVKNLGLTRIAAVYRELVRRAQEEKWPQRRLLGELFSEEDAFRRSRALELRVRRANIPDGWSLDTFPFHRQPGVSRAQIEELGELDWILKAINLVFIGRTGVGKTGLASSLLLKALFDGRTGMSFKAQDMLDELHRSIADRRTRYFMNKLVRLDVLLIDEMGYLTLNTDQTNLFFKLMDARYRAKRPTLITTNLGYDEWGAMLKNPPMADALLSRLKQHCVTLEIDGPDLREPDKQN